MNLIADIAAIEQELDEIAARTEIIRVRVRPDQKAHFAKCSAALGLPSATHAYRLMMNAVYAHVRPKEERRKGASRRPLTLPSRAAFGGAPRPLRV